MIISWTLNRKPGFGSAEFTELVKPNVPNYHRDFNAPDQHTKQNQDKPSCSQPRHISIINKTYADWYATPAVTCNLEVCVVIMETMKATATRLSHLDSLMPNGLLPETHPKQTISHQGIIDNPIYLNSLYVYTYTLMCGSICWFCRACCRFKSGDFTETIRRT